MPNNTLNPELIYVGTKTRTYFKGIWLKQELKMLLLISANIQDMVLELMQEEHLYFPVVDWSKYNNFGG